MKSSYLLTLLLVLTACAAKKPTTTDYGTFTDPRDNQVYKTVKIGQQVWMAQNLNFKIDGADYYDRNVANGDTYGMLYGFYAAQGAAPKGWHVPSEAEWQQLDKNCDDPVKTLNITFGGEHGGGKFRYMNAKATFYTTTHDGTPIITRYIDKGDNVFRTNRQGTAWQLSVRCVKDATAE
jgi:hypothetical protein